MNPFLMVANRSISLDHNGVTQYPEQALDGALSLCLRIAADKYTSGFTGSTLADASRFVKDVLESYSKNNVLTQLFNEQFCNILRS